MLLQGPVHILVRVLVVFSSMMSLVLDTRIDWLIAPTEELVYTTAVTMKMLVWSVWNYQTSRLSEVSEIVISDQFS